MDFYYLEKTKILIYTIIKICLKIHITDFYASFIFVFLQGYEESAYDFQKEKEQKFYFYRERRRTSYGTFAWINGWIKQL